ARHQLLSNAKGASTAPFGVSAARDRPSSIDHTVGMAPTSGGSGPAQGAGGLRVGGDLEQALADVPVPSYVLDTSGFVRWINPAAERILGYVRGRHFTSIVGPEDRTKAQELFARKVLGTTA